ncbi:MAG TPA: 2-amino-4-hydroxy-6-hydroxymethyldihydropteridine diphosphokinase [Cyclobacteriaceae bacterium]|nr:2-amino-4-hydroxy-6-hydroxymethyldihydropteridine diphosphokinase [Cyclobacteriaceae bacterium]
MRNGIFLLLGSNIGDTAGNLSTACREIDTRIGNIVKSSSVYKTEPWGITNQPVFLNQVVMAETGMNALMVLERITAIERAMGRVRNKKWGARIIDIDILFYGEKIIHRENLDIPHKGIPFRRFTLEPLFEIAPGFTHPELQKTIAELLAECEDMSLVERLL